MNVKYTKENHTGKIRQNRKENGFYKQLHIIDLEAISERICVRWYMPGKSRIYCCIWIHHPSKCVSGGGFAGGYGYCKASAAFDNACSDAGIKLSESVSGRGMESVELALQAMGEELLGHSNFYIARANA